MINKFSLKKTNIVIFTKSIDGGTGTFVLDILKLNTNKLSRNCTTKVLVLEKPAFRKPTKFHATFFARKKSYPNYYSLSITNCVKFYKEFVWFKKNITNLKPNIILSIDAHSNILTLIYKILFQRKIKVVATTHIDLLKTISTKSSIFTKLVLKSVIHIFYDYADTLIGVSKGVSRNLKQDFGLYSNIRTIYNGISTKRSIEPRKTKPLNNVVLITIARLDDQKDIETIIYAFNLLFKKAQNIRLLVLGDGPNRQSLELLAKKLNLDKKIKFTGWVKNVRSYIAQSSIFILSSKREGFPYALLEALSQGIPVVSTNTPYGPKEILGNGKYGVLVPIGRPDIMNEAMDALLTNKQKYNYFSQKSKERSKLYSVDKMLEQYRDVFIKLSKK